MDATETHLRSVLYTLARYQRENGFDTEAELVDEYTFSDLERNSWSSVDAFLVAVADDVWKSFHNAGGACERPVYARMAAMIDAARRSLSPAKDGA